METSKEKNSTKYLGRVDNETVHIWLNISFITLKHIYLRGKYNRAIYLPTVLDRFRSRKIRDVSSRAVLEWCFSAVPLNTRLIHHSILCSYGLLKAYISIFMKEIFFPLTSNSVWFPLSQILFMTLVLNYIYIKITIITPKQRRGKKGLKSW